MARPVAADRLVATEAGNRLQVLGHLGVAAAVVLVARLGGRRSDRDQ